MHPQTSGLTVDVQRVHNVMVDQFKVLVANPCGTPCMEWGEKEGLLEEEKHGTTLHFHCTSMYVVVFEQ